MSDEICIHCGKHPDNCQRAECMHIPSGRPRRAVPAPVAVSEGLSDPAIPFTYASTQATNCAGCGEYKHTPLRVDLMDGYVCLTCIDKRLESLLEAEQCRSDGAAPLPLSDAEIDDFATDYIAIEECTDSSLWRVDGGAFSRDDLRDFAQAIEAEVTRRLGRGSDGAVQAAWRPIETAPKVGYLIGAWKDGKWQAREMWWDDEQDQWTDTRSDMFLDPTHWMPLPAAPEASTPTPGGPT